MWSSIICPEVSVLPSGRRKTQYFAVWTRLESTTGRLVRHTIETQTCIEQLGHSHFRQGHIQLLSDHEVSVVILLEFKKRTHPKHGQ
jgi:hypothetical protein